MDMNGCILLEGRSDAMSGARKGTYKVTNWAEYNNSLVRRGDITYWFDEDALAAWEHANDAVKVGRPYTYSDTAIESLLVLRECFRLPYRQTEGLARSLLKLMEADVSVPDFTLLAKRAAKLNVAIKLRDVRGPIDVVVDSTGLKVYGEGEWKMRKHGKGKRRTWRKLHLAVNPATGEIEAEALTENSGHDADQVEPLLNQVNTSIDKFYGDGAFDQRKVYDTLAARTIQPVIPPRRNAKIIRHGNTTAQAAHPRDVALRIIRGLGRRWWNVHSGYHRRSLAETAMYRMKSCFGEKLKNRVLANQRTETRLRCKILNHFTQLGMPQFEWS
jgi:hypothetical protein